MTDDKVLCYTVAGTCPRAKTKTTEFIFASASVKREIFGAQWKSSAKILPCRESVLLFQLSSYAFLEPEISVGLRVCRYASEGRFVCR